MDEQPRNLLDKLPSIFGMVQLYFWCMIASGLIVPVFVQDYDAVMSNMHKTALLLWVIGMGFMIQKGFKEL